MIFVDTNYFLRYMTQSTDPASARMSRIANEFFNRVERGEDVAMTSGIVLRELCNVLISPRQYGYPAETVVELMRGEINLKGFRFEATDKALYLRALDILEANPKLEFSDAAIAARVERLNIPLATFDDRLGTLPTITRYSSNS